MNKNDLAMRMLLWARNKKQLDEEETIIRAAVLALKETVVTGNVRATYNSGRRTFDYEGAVRVNIDPEKETHKMLLEEHTKTITTFKTDWIILCEAFEIPKDTVPFTQPPPSVTLKLEDN